MKDFTLSVGGITSLLLLALGVTSSGARAQKSPASPLAGTWTLVAADVERPDGTRDRDYGASPRGLMVIDTQGHYSVQIYKSERPKFAAGDKQKGTAAEFEAAVLGSSCHFGLLEVDSVRRTLTYVIEGSSFPNWEGTKQVRAFELRDDELSYRVPPRANGDVPISVWRRVK